MRIFLPLGAPDDIWRERVRCFQRYIRRPRFSGRVRNMPEAYRCGTRRILTTPVFDISGPPSSEMLPQCSYKSIFLLTCGSFVATNKRRRNDKRPRAMRGALTQIPRLQPWRHPESGVKACFCLVRRTGKPGSASPTEAGEYYLVSPKKDKPNSETRVEFEPTPPLQRAKVFESIFPDER
jgi:hypothetical protein